MNITVDAHIDLPWIQTKYGPFNLGFEQPKESGRSVDFPRMMRGGLKAFFAALYLPDSWQDKMTQKEVIEHLLQQYNRLNSAPCSIVVTEAGVSSAYKHGKIPVFVGMEGGRLLGTSLGNLDTWARLGVKYLTLTHNRNTSWANSATDSPAPTALGKFGIEVLKRLHKLGMWADISHVHDNTIMDVFEHAEGTVLATHSGCRKLVNHPRNLPDWAIAGCTRTMIGVPYAKKFIQPYRVADHIDHIAQLTGTIKCIGIGSDLDGASMITECPDVSHWNHWMTDLSKMGYSDEAIADIGGNNWLRQLNGDLLSGTTTKPSQAQVPQPQLALSAP
jgi:membrane dipeptidase